MATEKRLIDANEALGKFKELPDLQHFAEWYVLYDSACNVLKNAPTVDAVEVVRCRDCGNSEPCNPPRGRVWCKKLCRYMKEDGYCSEPERKTNGMQG